jgi:uncharacterized protein
LQAAVMRAPDKRMSRAIYCLGLLLLCTAFTLQAQSPVWKVDKDGRTMFIAGSLHVLTAEDYPLPAAFETAYRQSAQVVFETDIAKMESPVFQQYMLRELSFGDGRNLQQVLRTDTYQAVEVFFTTRGVPMTSIDGFKPGMVAMLMTMVEMQRIGISAAGVDTYFDQRAKQDNKAKHQLETVEQQVAFIANMGMGREDAMLSYSLAEIERLPGLWRAMTRAWRSGDLPWLEEMLAQPMRTDFPMVYQSLLVERNNAWIPQLEAMAKTEQVEFVLVGALHLSGADGLLAQLATRGYRINQLP